MTDLFAPPPPAGTPLAERLRPRTIAEVVGQRHLLGAGQAARRRVRVGQAAFDDPVGAAGRGQDDARAADGRRVQRRLHRDLGRARRRQGHPRRGRARRGDAARNRAGATILFVDEVHRFNKAQQDAFLPFVEQGAVTFIGATTENPSFEVNRRAAVARGGLRAGAAVAGRARRSCSTARCAVAMPGVDGRRAGARRADRLCRRRRPAPDQPRRAARDRGGGRPKRATVDLAFVEATIARSLRRFDKGGEAFYDQISALHKSVRGSDPDAALYWMCRMLDGGADPLYVGAPDDPHGDRGHRPRRPARAAHRARRGRDLRAAGLARRRARAGASACSTSRSRRSRTPPTSAYSAARAFIARGRLAPGAAAPAQRADQAHEGPRLRQGLPLRARRGGRVRGGRDATCPTTCRDATFYEPTDRGLEARIREKLERLRARDAMRRASDRRDRRARRAGDRRCGCKPSDRIDECSTSTCFATTSPRVAAGARASAASRSTPPRFEALERERKDIQTRTQDLQAQRNALSKQIGIAKGKGEDAAPLLAEVAGLGDEAEARSKASSTACRRELRDFLLDLPNLTHASHAGRQRRPTTTSRCAAGARRATFDFPAEGPHRHRRGPRAARLRDGGEALRRALLVPARRPRAPAPRARAVHARHAHARARLHRVLHALHRQRRDAGRHRRSCRSSRPTCSRCRRAARKARASRST